MSAPVSSPIDISSELSGPVDISSLDPAPNPITISSDSSPAQVYGTLSYTSQAPLWKSPPTDCSISIGPSSRLASPVVHSHAPGMLPACVPSLLGGRIRHPANVSRYSNVSHPAGTSRPAKVSQFTNISHPVSPDRSAVSAAHTVSIADYHELQVELARFREKCKALEMENSELKGRVESLE